MKQRIANAIFAPVFMGVVALVVLFLLGFSVAWLVGSLSMIALVSFAKLRARQRWSPPSRTKEPRHRENGEPPHENISPSPSGLSSGIETPTTLYARQQGEELNAWGQRIMRLVESRGYWSLTANDVQEIAEYVVAEHFPLNVPGNLEKAAKVRTFLAARIKENFERYGMKPVPIRIEDRPITITLAGRTFRQDALEHNTLQFAEAFAAKDISDLTDSERVGIRSILVNGIQNHLDPGKIQSMLFDRFGALNRDWERVAITEVRSALVNGYLASLRPGTRVKRQEMSNCCPHCAQFDGRIYTVRDPADPNKDWANDAWVGKTNIGRSGKRHKMVNGQLVARTPDELYVIAPLIHQSCRGGFIAMNERPTNPQLQSLYDRKRQMLQERGLAAIMGTFDEEGPLERMVAPTTNSQVQAGRDRLRAMLQERGIRSVV